MTLDGRTFGQELALDPNLSAAERLYVRLFGVPIQGMRIRARYLLPVIERLRSEKVATIADAGSGRGLFTFHLARAFPQAEVVGMDLDRDQAARNNAVARHLGLTNCRFEVRDVTALDALGSYDLILSVDNLEHLEDDREQCRIFFRALRPGGRLLIHVPNEMRNVFGWKSTNFMGIVGHVRPGYTRETLVSHLEEAGFDIEEASYSYNSIETFANFLSYLITGGREKRKVLYAFSLPFLLALSWLGSFSRPKRGGSGVVVLAKKPMAGLSGEGSPGS